LKIRTPIGFKFFRKLEITPQMNSATLVRFCTLKFFLLSWLIMSFTAQAKTPAENQVIADIAFKDLKGNRHHLSDYRGKWLFLNFWAGYCPICQKEAQTLIRFQQQNRNNVTVLGINYGNESKQQISAAVKRNQYDYLIIPDQASISRVFNDVVGTPTTIVISPQGRLIAKAIGRQSYQELTNYISHAQGKKDNPRIWDLEYSEH
jgi:thiol-disulfide isomerase/thioredoxin